MQRRCNHTTERPSQMRVETDEILAKTGLLIVGDELDDTPEEAGLGEKVMGHMIDWLTTHPHVLHGVISFETERVVRVRVRRPVRSGPRPHPQQERAIHTSLQASCGCLAAHLTHIPHVIMQRMVR